METFVDHMILVCFSFVVIMLVLGVPVYIVEKLNEKYDNKIYDKIISFFVAEPDEDE